MIKPKVYIVQTGVSMYNTMFEERGFEVVDSVADADLMQFIGGADVNPAMYKHTKHNTTHFVESVDLIDSQFFELGKRHNIPMAGICRGGQFLNVCNGGTLIQDCDGHAVGSTHIAIDVASGATIEVSSTHHQMMRMGIEGEMVATANESTYTEIHNYGHPIKVTMVDDAEVVYYKDTNSLCFQPHPEFNGVKQCRDYYFACLERFLGVALRDAS